MDEVTVNNEGLDEEAVLAELCVKLRGHILPAWEELPDIWLYLDQVLACMSKYLSGYPGYEEKALTGAMVNNYVKLGIMPAPVKKKYERVHLAYLIMICILKPVLPIPSIRQMIDEELKTGTSPEALYEAFRARFHETSVAVADAAGQQESAPLTTAVFYASLRAQAEQAAALSLLQALTDTEPKKK